MAEVRDLIPTLWTPTPKGTFGRVHASLSRLRLLISQFITVHRCSPRLVSTAEVIAEVDPLRVVQEVRLRDTCLSKSVSWPSEAMRLNH